MTDEIINIGIENVTLSNVSEKKFLDYAMYVIKGRALPDIRDGMKPVHRRILYAQDQLGNYYNKGYKKSARVVGDVIGKYHPHGDVAVYDALVRMAQPFSMRAPLVDGQGNFGSIDGDPAAAMRYTEQRQSKFADSMFADLDKDVVKMVDNYDGTEKMPEVLPVRFPNLLVNGSEGIAVGMATSIPTHNPIEVLNCVKYLIEKNILNEEVVLSELMKLMPSPDFPTGGLVHSLSDYENAWNNGRAKFKIRSKWHEEETVSGRTKLIITEIPYQVKKELVIEKISNLASPDKSKGGFIAIEGISDIKDESSKDGMRVAITLKKDVDAEILFNTLVKYTQLEVPFSYNMTVLVDGSPELVGITKVLESFVEYREEVIVNRTTYLKNKAFSRAYMLEGLDKALNALDQVIELIKAAANPSEACVKLVDFLSIQEDQARFILEMKLSKLTSSQREDLETEINKLRSEIAYYEEILSSHIKRLEIMMEETEDQITLFANTADADGQYSYGRRLSEWMSETLGTDLAALTKEEDCTIFFSNKGYVRRIPVSDLEQQNRGTRGKKQMKVSEGDYIQKVIPSHSHDILAIITQKGKVYALPAYEISDAEKGRHLNNIIELPDDEKVLMILPVDFKNDDLYLTMLTKNGNVKRTSISQYSGNGRKAGAFRKSGVIGITLREHDELIYADVCKSGDDVVMINDKNLIIRFPINADSVRPLSRTSMGVRGMNLIDSKVIGGAVISSDSEGFLSCVSTNGMVKITNINQYRTQNRGGKGVRAFKSNERTGDLFKALVLDEQDTDLITTTQKGISNRINLSKITVTNRNTSGVKLIKIDEGDFLADVINVDPASEDELLESQVEIASEEV
jgi:DNA gyrase subunit A